MVVRALAVAGDGKRFTDADAASEEVEDARAGGESRQAACRRRRIAADAAGGGGEIGPDECARVEAEEVAHGAAWVGRKR